MTRRLLPASSTPAPRTPRAAAGDVIAWARVLLVAGAALMLLAGAASAAEALREGALGGSLGEELGTGWAAEGALLAGLAVFASAGVVLHAARRLRRDPDDALAGPLALAAAAVGAAVSGMGAGVALALLGGVLSLGAAHASAPPRPGEA